MALTFYQILLSELLGTMTLIAFGSGVSMAVSLKKSFAEGGGWIVVIIGWGIAVMFGAYVAFPSGGHLNPSVSFSQLILGNITISKFFAYIIGQFLGAFLGAALAYTMYHKHFKLTENKDIKLGVFCTSSATNTPIAAFFSQIIGTFFLIFVLLMLSYASIPSFAGPVIAATLVIGIGASMGGTDGYAINPARDLAPRFFHTVFPIHNKGSSHWEYAWVPLFGPLVGATIATILYKIVIGFIA